MFKILLLALSTATALSTAQAKAHEPLNLDGSDGLCQSRPFTMRLQAPQYHNTTRKQQAASFARTSGQEAGQWSAGKPDRQQQLRRQGHYNPSQGHVRLTDERRCSSPRAGNHGKASSPDPWHSFPAKKTGFPAFSVFLLFCFLFIAFPLMTALTGGKSPVAIFLESMKGTARKTQAVPEGNDKSGNKSKTLSAQQNMQYARDQAAQAESAASRASSGNRELRLAAAEQARYHAGYASEAAGRAAAAASGGPPEAAEAATAARDAAERARAAADRAGYSASIQA